MLCCMLWSCGSCFVCRNCINTYLFFTADSISFRTVSDIFARPSSVIFPDFINSFARFLFNSDQFDMSLRGVKRWLVRSLSIDFAVESIHPMHSASSTISAYVTVSVLLAAFLKYTTQTQVTLL